MQSFETRHAGSRVNSIRPDVVWFLVATMIFFYFFNMRTVWFYRGNASFMQMMVVELFTVGAIAVGGVRSSMILSAPYSLSRKVLLLVMLNLPAPAFIYLFGSAQGLIKP